MASRKLPQLEALALNWLCSAQLTAPIPSRLHGGTGWNEVDLGDLRSHECSARSENPSPPLTPFPPLAESVHGS